MKNKRLLSFITAIFMVFSFCTILTSNISVPLEVSASGVDNIAARADYLYNTTWTAQATVQGWRNNYTFSKGSTYHIPYGQPVTKGKYICWGVSVDNFLSATKNASSEFYSTRSYYSGNSGSYSTYYAMDCSAFVSYCWGLSSRTTTSSWSSLSVTSYGKCTSANVGKIQQGDALNLAGSHIVLVSRVNSNGTYDITEETPPELKRSTLTSAQLVSKYSNYTIYRYNKRDSVPPPPSVPNDPPGIPTLNISKNLFSADETINISFDPIENATWYFMSLYRNGELYKNEGIDCSIKLNLPAGDYIAYVSANNDYGNAGVDSVKFKVYDTVPSVPDLKMEKNLFSANETVNISFDSIENTEYYFMSLYRNGELYKNEGVDCSINLNLPAGDYIAYVSANNNYGNAGVDSVKLKVYDTVPEIPKLKINKTVFLKDEEVNISFNSIENTEWYFMSLYRNGELCINEGVENSINLKLPVGNYLAYVSANNNYGNAGTDSIKFSVIEKGDVNSDGDFNISDIVLLQKWLLATPDTELAYWKAADLCEDDRLDVFDLCLMKRMLVENS